MKYKAVLIDVDGTLVVNKKDGVPTQRVSEAINNASKLVHIGVATSRCFSGVSYLIPYLNLSGPSVLNGGAHVIDIIHKHVYYEVSINTADSTRIQKELQKRNLPVLMCDGTNDCTLPSVLEKPHMIFSQGMEDSLADSLIDSLSSLPKISVHKTRSWTKGKSDVLVTHASATKQHGILEVAKVLGITPQEIIGIGDGYNDFPLLMACGLKVAMGNAIPDLKEIADYIAPSVDEDGVAHVIEKFILQ